LSGDHVLTIYINIIADYEFNCENLIELSARAKIGYMKYEFGVMKVEFKLADGSFSGLNGLPRPSL
jgi:hypothetical protein